VSAIRAAIAIRRRYKRRIAALHQEVAKINKQCGRLKKENERLGKKKESKTNLLLQNYIDWINSLPSEVGRLLPFTQFEDMQQSIDMNYGDEVRRITLSLSLYSHDFRSQYGAPFVYQSTGLRISDKDLAKEVEERWRI